MTIECYFTKCPHHSIHQWPDDGPFCYEEECLATEKEIDEYHEERRYELEISKWRSKGYTVLGEHDSNMTDIRYTLLWNAELTKIRVYFRGDVWKSNDTTGAYELHAIYKNEFNTNRTT